MSLKFRDPLSAVALSDFLLPLKRIVTQHEDVNAYVTRAGGLNKAILSVLTEKDTMRYSEGHVSITLQQFYDTDC